MNDIQAALGLARKHREAGGDTSSRVNVKTPYFSGPIHSSVSGRTDHLPMTVASGSYVIPADIVSAGGEGSTLAGFKILRRTFGGAPYGQSGSPYGKSGGPYDSPAARATGGRTQAAGILFISPDKEVLLLKRAGGDHSGEWGFPAGKVEKGETPQQAAKRETEEEAGYSHEGGLSPFMRTDVHGPDFSTFVAHANKFKPHINSESSDAKWVTPTESEKLSLHPGVRAALEKLRARKASGGSSSGVPIVAAGGEWVVPPEHVRAVGNGDIDMGHRVLDAFVLRARKELIHTLNRLPGPKRN